MGIIGKFVSRGWNGIKNGFGTAGKLIKSAAGKAWNFIKENHEPIEKLAGTALTTGLLIKSGGAAVPFILEGSNLIQSLPDNGWTKHLKNIAKGAVLDYCLITDNMITDHILFTRIQRRNQNKRMRILSIKLHECQAS